MFERYTETARRAVFFARFEASRFGSREIQTEHILLGILRMDVPLVVRLLSSTQKADAIRQEIESHHPDRKSTDTAVDLPLSKECRRALAFANREAEQFHHRHIGPEHLLLGLFLEESCEAAKILRENGVTPTQLREAAASSGETPSAPRPPAAGPRKPDFHDLTAAAADGKLTPLVGRQEELGRVLQILSRRTRRHVALIGEPGVGRSAIVSGLAQRIAEGMVVPPLASRTVLAIDAIALIDLRSPNRPGPLPGGDAANTILCIEGLFDLAASQSALGILEAVHLLEPHLASEGLQCIATGTPFGLRMTIERAPALARHFEVVSVLPPSEAESVQILSAMKPQFEDFHGVTYAEGTEEAAVHASGHFLRHRNLPDRAIDLLDEAGAHVKLRRESEPREIAFLRRQIRVLNRNMENAIARHEFTDARGFADQEARERQNLDRLLEEHKRNSESAITVTVADIHETVANRVGAPLAAVQSVLAKAPPTRVEQDLAAQLPAELREQIPFLASYLAACTEDDVERLLRAIRKAKATPGQ